MSVRSISLPLDEAQRLAEYRRRAYAKANQLGGPAGMFSAMAERIEAGEDWDAVLRDYGGTVAAQSNGHSPDTVRSAQPSGEQACEGARASGESPAPLVTCAECGMSVRGAIVTQPDWENRSSAPAPEPVAWAWFHRGAVNFDGSDALRELDDLKATPIPLYAAPPQPEAVALLREVVCDWNECGLKSTVERIRAFLEQHK